MTDYLAAAKAMLGPAQNRYTDPSAWDRLHRQLGVHLPFDYQVLVDAYAGALSVPQAIHLPADQFGREGRAAGHVEHGERRDGVPGAHHDELLIAVSAVLRAHGDDLSEAHGLVADLRRAFYSHSRLELPPVALSLEGAA
ncbi:hypothetical protein [Streptomyces sp. NPDC007883]|uniref:hypothetical protein n=1 Tax=Streptomyces sp. NPDC007883 TaxID=3155116 RepID=UPI0033E8FA13